MSDNDIRCPVCNTLLGKIEGNKVVMKHGDRSYRVYGQGVVLVDCHKVYGHIPCAGVAEMVLPK